jgi:hypothetical protein
MAAVVLRTPLANAEPVYVGRWTVVLLFAVPEGEAEGKQLSSLAWRVVKIMSRGGTCCSKPWQPYYLNEKYRE